MTVQSRVQKSEIRHGKRPLEKNFSTWQTLEPYDGIKETGISSQLESTWAELFRLTKFRVDELLERVR